MNWQRPRRNRLGATLAFLASLVLPTLVAGAGEAIHAINPEGRTELTLTGPGRKLVQVVLSMSKVEDTFPYKDALFWGGDVGELPQQIVISMKVRDGSQMIFVPLSAYGDLGDVRSASLDPTSRGFILNLHGGATAASYDAKLTFEGGYLLNRAVALREFPQQRREDTTYSFPKRTGE